MHRSLLRRAWQTFSFCLIGALTAGLMAPALRADSDPPPVPVTAADEAAKTPAGPPAPAPAAALDQKLEPLTLDKLFERTSSGIALRPPIGWTPIAEVDREEQFRFVDNVQKPQWTLALTRRSFPEGPQHLFQKKVEKDFQEAWEPGIVENTLAALQAQFPGSKILRPGDPTNIGKYDVGVIVMRYTKNGERWLVQHAIIESNPQLYFLLSFTSPGRKDIAEDDLPIERTVDRVEAQAVATFRKIIDSVELLDLAKVKADQDARLLRTRGLFVNLNERNLNAKLVKERFNRVIRDGVDIGYSYQVEFTERKMGNDGIRVGVRTRIMSDVKNGVVQPFPREDSEAWMFTTPDRRIEEWSKIIVFDDGKPKDEKNPWKKLSEVGATQYSERRILAVDATDPTAPEKRFLKGENGDPNQPWVDVRQNFSLKVEFFGGKANLEPVVRPLPPFYLPQALGAMMPQIIPPNEPKTYLFASYVSEIRQVMLRYVDVGLETNVPAIISTNSGKLQAVPITDRIGMDGSPTIHWVTNKGEYLGSTTEATKTAVVPTDRETLMRIWKINDEVRRFEDPRNAVPPSGAFPGSTQQPAGGLPEQIR